MNAYLVTDFESHNWDSFFMHIAHCVARMSTCASVQVGAVLVANNHIIATGYNGVPSGCEHCNTIFDKDKIQTDLNVRAQHHEWANIHEIHAEVNAIIDAGKRGTLTKDMTLYSTVYPCIACSKIIVAAGITRVVYGDKYDYDPSQLASTIFGECNIKVECIINEDSRA